MPKMKAALLHQFNGIDGIEMGEIDIPPLKEDEVLIETHFAAINPVDWKIAEGYFKDQSPYQFPIILGRDISGVIKEKGALVKDFDEGDEVLAFCQQETLQYGSFAQFLCLKASKVVQKPETLTFSQAASFPLVSLTARQALDAAQLKRGEDILIHAGAGGVGGFAIQFALQAGAHVLTTASSSHHLYVKKLGAHEIFDYKKAPFAEQILAKHPNGLDVVLDAVGGETLVQSYKIIKKQGRLVTISGQLNEALLLEKQIKGQFVFASANKKQLEKIAQMLDHGQLTPPPLQIFEFDEIKKALHQLKKGGIEGKLVIKIK